MADIKREDVLVYLENANMLEISELIKEIEDKFGVTAAVPVAIAGGAAPAGEAGEAEEQSEFGIEFGFRPKKAYSTNCPIFPLFFFDSKELKLS